MQHRRKHRSHAVPRVPLASPGMEIVYADARRHGTALTLALAARDELAIAIVGARLRLALVRLRDQPIPADQRDLVAALEHLVANTRPMFTAEPAAAQRVLRWARARRRPHAARTTDPDLFEVRAATTELGPRCFELLHVARSSFASCSLAGSTFDGVVFEDCDLARANLERTRWRGARLVRCSFAGSVLVDAMLDDAVFIDCDLRGADLAAVHRVTLATSRRTEWVRCDLRESNWNRRLLAGTRFGRCSFYGVHGLPRLEALEIDHPDLSLAGDGSEIGRPHELVARWSSTEPRLLGR
jgi:hypothetical protein